MRPDTDLLPIDEIILPLVGRPEERLAVEYAAAIADRGSVPLRVLHEIGPGRTIAAAARRREAIDDLIGPLDLGTSISIDDVVGEVPPDALIEHLAGRPGALVCMTTHARSATGQLLWGSVAVELARRSPVPILLVGPRALAVDVAVPIADLVVALDGSPDAERVIGPALRLARLLRLNVRLCGVAPTESPDQETGWGPDQRYLAGIGGTLANESVAVTWELVHGTDAPAGLARLSGTAIVAMATHARPIGERFRQGSVVVAVTADALSPVLVVGPRCGTGG